MHATQEPALVEAAEVNEQVWAEEIAAGGRRKFIVASFERFWQRYRRLRPAFRHLYEVVRADTPCHLYLDLEFYTATNLGRDGPRMMATVRRELTAALLAQYGLTLAPAHVVELDSTSDRKFSRHLLARLPGMAFADNAHVGRFVRGMCHGLQARRASEPDVDELWVRPPLPPGAVSPTSATEAAPSPLVADRPPPRGAEAHASDWAAARPSQADCEESESDGQGAATEQSESESESPISKRRRYERAEARRGALEQKTIPRARTPPRLATSPMGGAHAAVAAAQQPARCIAVANRCAAVACSTDPAQAAATAATSSATASTAVTLFAATLSAAPVAATLVAVCTAAARQSAAPPCSAPCRGSADVPIASDRSAPSRGADGPSSSVPALGRQSSGGGEGGGGDGGGGDGGGGMGGGAGEKHGRQNSSGSAGEQQACAGVSSGGGAGEQQACSGAHEGSSSSAAHRGAAETCFVDLGVYTRNRCFR